MRIQMALLCGLAAVSAAFAQTSPENWAQPSASIRIWTDKYTYSPGDKATLKWTVKQNGDEYPYTVVAFRQNNQTGVKSYLPGNTATATDLSGNSAADGFAAATLSEKSKETLGEITIPDEPGMHTVTVQLRDQSGTRVLRAAYMKIGVVKETVTLSGEITADRTLTNDKLWRISGVVTVKNNATLSIEPGTFVFGTPGSSPPSLLLVTRNGKISARGTKSRPIVMTSSQPFGERKRGDWGGLIMLGKAPVNVGSNTSGGICGAGGCNNAAGTFYIEGLVANDDGLYGGSDPNHNCGALEYVRVEYAGSILSPNNETNSFTFGGCGKGTVAHHLQAIFGLDDSFEWFGGTMDAKYLVGGLGADDYVDFQLGYTGRIQYGLFYQSPDSRGNRGIEGDNSEYNQAAEPYSNPTMYNLTFVGSGQPGFDEANAPGIFLRRGSRGTFNNIVVTNFYSPGVDISDASTQAQADLGNVRMDGIMLWGNGIGTNAANTLEGQAASGYTVEYANGRKGPGGKGAGANFVAVDPRFTARLFEWGDPSFMVKYGSPVFRAGFVAAPDDGFFDQTARFIGGIGDEDWTDEWTSWLIDAELIP